MIFISLLLFFSGVIDTKPAPVLTDVYIAGKGPYRFLVDTGAETSMIDPTLASKLGLQPEFRSEVVTQLSSQLVPGTKARNLKIGNRALPETELLFQEIEGPRRIDSSVQGVLGLNALTTFDFTLTPNTHKLDHSAKRPAGTAVPFSMVEGRMTVKARMGRETLTLILDSGSTNIVLFRKPEAMTNVPPVTGVFGTIDGARSEVPTCWSADMFFGETLRVGTLPAAIVERKGSETDGLLPASIFKKIYVDHARSELVLVR
jgi:predicted aspartyl protease